MKRIFIVLLMTALSSGHLFGAQLTAGTRQLTVDGHLDQREEINFNLGAAAGYFLRDYVEIGVRGGLDMEHGNDVMSVYGGGFSEYNFALAGSSTIVPYLGTSLMLKYSSIDTPLVNHSEVAIEVGGSLGVRYFIQDNFAIGTAARIFFATEDIYIGDDAEFEAYDWDLILSTSFYF
jgi:hypothetical protein